MNKKTDTAVRKNLGFTITEVLVTVGIIGILATISYNYYMKHYDITSKLASLQKIGSQALHQMQICVEQSVIHTGKETFEAVPAKNWDGCTSKALLNLQSCEGCEEPQTNSDKTALGIVMKEGRFQQCVAYRINNINHPFKVTLKTSPLKHNKVCFKNASDNFKKSAVWPYKICKNDSDCASKQECAKGHGAFAGAKGKGGCR